MANPDASREAAHLRYEEAKKVADNSDVSLDEALAQKNWNLDWQPGDPTYQEIHDNWDYFVQQQQQAQQQQPQAQEQVRSEYGTTPLERTAIQPSESTVQQMDRRVGEDRPDDDVARAIVSNVVRNIDDSGYGGSEGGKIEEERSEDNRLNPKIDRDKSQNQQNYDIDPSKLAQALQEDQQNRLEHGRDITRDALVSMYSSVGADINDPVFQQVLSDVDNITTLPYQAQEVQRRFFDNESGDLRNPLDWNILGFTSQQKTQKAAKDIYDYYFNQEDSNILGPNTPKPWTASEGMARYSLDDGVSPQSRQALYMTGEQYRKYREQFGLPGRDVNQINDNEIYNKQDEMEQYGFIPYITNDWKLDEFHDMAAGSAISNVFNGLADARRNLTDYTLDYDGQQYSGKDFDKNIRLWDQRTSNNKPKLVYDQADADEYAIPQALYAYDADNDKTYVAPNKPISRDVQGDGSIRWRFNDNPNDDWVFENEQDEAESTSYQPAKNDEYVAAWLNQEPLVLDSGQTIRADKAADLWRNYDNYADYGPFDIARPSVENPVTEGGWAPWFVDMALSSAPYFNPLTAATKAAGDAANNFYGYQPGYRDQYSRTYSLLSDNPTEDQRLTATTGSLAMPMTERMWGPLGEAMFKTGPTKFLLNNVGRIPETVLDKTIPRWLTGASDEGFEEILGNIVEDYQQNGLGWYANDRIKRDENGEPVLDNEGNQQAEIDSQGRAVKEDTPLLERIRNYIASWPLAYLGGATLGGVLGAAAIPDYYNEYKESQDERNEFGNNAKSVPVDVEALLATEGLSDADRRYYNR